MLINSIRKAARVLRVISREDGMITLSQIAKKTGFPTATVGRLCNTLLSEGFLTRSQKSYGLGPFALELGKRAETSLGLQDIAKPYLEELREETEENANLAVLDGREVVYLACAESRKMMRAFTVPGARVPAHATGVGKVLLAALPEEEVKALFQDKPMVRYTAKTIGDMRELLRQLEKARLDGYALDQGEREEGVVCVAAPLVDHSGKVFAAISVSGPSSRLDPARLEEVKARVKASALKVSSCLGGR